MTKATGAAGEVPHVRPLERWYRAAAGPLAVFAGLLFLAGLAVLVLPAEVLDPVASIDSTQAALVVGISMLALDAVIPAPSSAVMIAMGAILGVGAAAIAATAGLVLAALAGYGLGFLASGPSERLSGEAGSDRVQALVRRNGFWAILVTRPIPLAAETAATVAGSAHMPLRSFIPAATFGSLAPAVAYSMLGSRFSTAPRLPLVVVSTITIVILALPLQRYVTRAKP